MSLGTQILDELGRREWRYGRLLYDEHQELKNVDSHAELNAFFARHNFPALGEETTAPEIADAFIAEWKKRDVKEVKVGLLTGLLAAPEGWVLLVLLSPLLLVGYTVRALYRFLTKWERKSG